MQSLFSLFWPCSSVVEQRKVHSEVVGSNPTLAKIQFQFPYCNFGRIFKKAFISCLDCIFQFQIVFLEKWEIVLQLVQSGHQGKILALIMSAPDLLAGYEIEF